MPTDRQRRRRRRRLIRSAALLVVLGGTVAGAIAGVEDHAGAANSPTVVDPFTSTAMRAFLATRHANISAALYDVDTGATYIYHPGDREQTASIVKVDILATVLHEAQEKHEPLDDDLQDLATGMIEQSDNDDANDLWADAGGAGAVGAFDRSIGMDDTTPNPSGYWGETLTTAIDQIRLLQHVALTNHVLHYNARDYELDLMQNVTPFEDWGVSAGPPRKGVSIALKNGWVPLVGDDWQVNSIGAIDGDGRNYLLAVLTNGDDGENYGIDTIEGISRRVWASLPRVPTRGATVNTTG
jgi:Beta-lactamase enzyme family